MLPHLLLLVDGQMSEPYLFRSVVATLVVRSHHYGILRTFSGWDGAGITIICYVVSNEPCVLLRVRWMSACRGTKDM